jgi:tetratricopeptide (TPR) repeat protein
MDCRAWWLLALGLVGVLGCTPQGTLPVTSPSVRTEPAADGGLFALLGGSSKRTPKAATCVAAGQYREQEASNPDRPQPEQARLREEARKAYHQAIRLDPDHVPAYQALARLYQSEKDYDHAVATYQTALKRHPKDAALWHELGMCHSQQKAWEPALASLHKAVELDPENRPYNNTLGYCLARAGRYDESLACFQKVNGAAQAHYNLARMQLHLRQDDLARQNLEAALQLDPQLAAAKQLLGQLQNGARPVVTVGLEGTETEG